MKITSKHLSIFVITVFAAASIYWIYTAAKFLERNGTESCFHSVAKEVDTALKQGRLTVHGVSRELTKDEIKKILAEAKLLDCGNSQDFARGIHIAIGEVNKTQKQINIKIWTNGDDGVPSTPDDIVFPHGETLP